MDARLPFDEAVTSFATFLDAQGWSSSLLWLSRDRLTGHRCDYWTYRPEELHCAEAARRWYEESCKDDWNLRLDGFAQYDGFTLAIVERGPGKSRMLNFGVITGEIRLHVVRSALSWGLRRAVCRIRGESPMLLHTDMPSRAEPVTAVDRGGNKPNPGSQPS
jgi:hypothetical protein